MKNKKAFFEKLRNYYTLGILTTSLLFVQILFGIQESSYLYSLALLLFTWGIPSLATIFYFHTIDQELKIFPNIVRKILNYFEVSSFIACLMGIYCTVLGKNQFAIGILIFAIAFNTVLHVLVSYYTNKKYYRQLH